MGNLFLTAWLIAAELSAIIICLSMSAESTHMFSQFHKIQLQSHPSEKIPLNPKCRKLLFNEKIVLKIFSILTS